MEHIVLKASDLDGYLTDRDRENIECLNRQYEEAIDSCKELVGRGKAEVQRSAKDNLIHLYNGMGKIMQEIVAVEPQIHVYSFETPEAIHGEASRLIAKLRDVRTQTPEFIYYIQRAYELLFNLAFGGNRRKRKAPH